MKIMKVRRTYSTTERMALKKMKKYILVNEIFL